MLTLLTVLAVGLLLVLTTVGTGAWLTVRRVRRSRLVTVGRDLATDGAAVLAACRPGATPNRTAALRAVRIAREHQLLRQRVERARRAGAHLGDVPELLPRLEAEGRRLRTALGQLVGVPASDAALAARADRHLATLADLSVAVAAATALPTADETLAQEAADAAAGLRVHHEAVTELTDVGRAGRS
jgi:DNA-binding helix-hairpin-helix protein with protein kinase domain